MNRLLLVMVAAILVTGSTACKKIKGKGDVVTETRTLPACTAIDLAMSEDVYFTPDSVSSLSLEGQQNVLDVIETQVEGGTLVIRLKNNYVLGSHDPVKISVHAPGITRLAVSGSGVFRVVRPWNDGSLQSYISGSGEIYLSDIEAGTFRADISGSGSIHGSAGKAGMLYTNISGSGGMQMEEIQADSVYATISGSGSMSLWAVKLLDATISGSGNIRYKGSPVVSTHISGSGSVKPL
jgi:hypothetical protein